MEASISNDAWCTCAFVVFAKLLAFTTIGCPVNVPLKATISSDIWLSCAFVVCSEFLFFFTFDCVLDFALEAFITRDTRITCAFVVLDFGWKHNKGDKIGLISFKKENEPKYFQH